MMVGLMFELNNVRLTTAYYKLRC